MTTEQPSILSVEAISDTEIEKMDMICGTSGTVASIAFAGFSLAFGALLYWLVLSDPNVPMGIKGIASTMFGIAVITLLFGGRLKRGWPAILADKNALYVVYDPAKSEFVKVPLSAISGCEKRMLYPNTMAVSVLLNEDLVTHEDCEILKKAIFPADNRLHVQTNFNSRSRIVSHITQLTQPTAA